MEGEDGITAGDFSTVGSEGRWGGTKILVSPTVLNTTSALQAGAARRSATAAAAAAVPRRGLDGIYSEEHL